MLNVTTHYFHGKTYEVRHREENVKGMILYVHKTDITLIGKVNGWGGRVSYFFLKSTLGVCVAENKIHSLIFPLDITLNTNLYST